MALLLALWSYFCSARVQYGACLLHNFTTDINNKKVPDYKGPKTQARHLSAL